MKIHCSIRSKYLGEKRRGAPAQIYTDLFVFSQPQNIIGEKNKDKKSNHATVSSFFPACCAHTKSLYSFSPPSQRIPAPKMLISDKHSTRKMFSAFENYLKSSECVFKGNGIVSIRSIQCTHININKQILGYTLHHGKMSRPSLSLSALSFNINK